MANKTRYICTFLYVVLLNWFSSVQSLLSNGNSIFTLAAPGDNLVRSIIIVRIEGGTAANLSWPVLPLDQVKAFVIFIIEYSQGSRKRQAGSGAVACSSPGCRIPYEQGSVLVRGLNPDQSVSFNITAVNEEEEQGASMMFVSQRQLQHYNVELLQYYYRPFLLYIRVHHHHCSPSPFFWASHICLHHHHSGSGPLASGTSHHCRYSYVSLWFLSLVLPCINTLLISSMRCRKKSKGLYSPSYHVSSEDGMKMEDRKPLDNNESRLSDRSPSPFSPEGPPSPGELHSLQTSDIHTICN